MPQFEVEPQSLPSSFVRARSDADAARRQSGRDDVEVGDPEPGSGWRMVWAGGEVWGRVRPRDRMRFRRD